MNSSSAREETDKKVHQFKSIIKSLDDRIKVVGSLKMLGIYLRSMPIPEPEREAAETSLSLMRNFLYQQQILKLRELIGSDKRKDNSLSKAVNLLQQKDVQDALVEEARGYAEGEIALGLQQPGKEEQKEQDARYRIDQTLNATLRKQIRARIRCTSFAIIDIV